MAKEIEEKARDNVIEGAVSSVESIKEIVKQISQKYESRKN